ncbi:McrB family protein [Aeromonas enteropelogenes]|uniref:McrB family protein n=1 Tax=Aeromonas enteropelogenes TaxID=29489 RepID=UPI0038D08AA2
MSFEDFCTKSMRYDKQRVQCQESFVISFNNEKDECFTIQPETLIAFLQFMLENYNQIENAWGSVPSKKNSLNIYEEKSYRAIYGKASDIDELKSISSIGRSQTKAITKVISKFIAYLLDEEYVGVESNTFFVDSYLKSALEKVASGFKAYENQNIKAQSLSTPQLKMLFENWLSKQSLSTSTIKKYSEQCIAKADEVVSSIDESLPRFYSVSDIGECEKLISILLGSDTWKDLNTAGNGMYSSGVTKYELFIRHHFINKPIPCHKQFLLFAGISGTGKTRFIREQVKDYPGQKNYCLVPVRPDWHEPSDLLGYISRISGKKEYVSTPVLHFITQAWIHIFEHVGEVRSDGKIGLSQEQLDHIPPFWLCLDEMNLAPVEQYFADYLSALETRHWYTSPELTAFNDKEGVEYDYLYQCAPLLKADTLSQQLDENARTELAEKLGLDLDISLHQQIWAYFCQHGIAIPFNLMVAGTVNMDETTHGFSRKVIDRALTFDFNEFFPNDFDAYFVPALQPKLLGYPTWSDGRAITEIPELEQFSKESVTFLKAVNGVLQQSPFELAYRSLNELMLALLAHHPANTAELVAIWDDFMMCKVLPRIEGDSDKLRSHQTADSDLLTDLEKVLAEQFAEHWEGTRPDLFNRKVAATDEDSILAVPCRSKKKLAWMKERLARQCFTSFWP